MNQPRFRLRSLVLLIVFAALVMGIVTLTRENSRLRAELKAAQQTQSGITFFAGVFDDVDANGVILGWSGRLDSGLSIDLTKPSAQALDMMPSGPDAFARSLGEK
jgi:hypothetical protein